MEKYVKKTARQARENSYRLSQLNEEVKNKILLRMADLLSEHKQYILAENEKDIAAAGKARLKKSFIDRLTLDHQRIAEMSCSLRSIAGLPDPLNRILKGWSLPNGLTLTKISVPLGVVMIIYEARPNVTSDCIGLCFKTSNVAILRGGKDALASNKAVFKILSLAVSEAGLSYAPFFLIDRPEHALVDLFLKENESIDLVIPRGGEDLIRKVSAASSIPVIKHYKGVCHIYVDQDADLDKALKICVNAKCQRPAVCNAVETILVHSKAAGKFLPRLKDRFDELKVTIKGDEQSRKYLPDIKKATVADWSTEYGDLTVSLKIVGSVEEAVAHINTYGSHHTDSILTENIHCARQFTGAVDSACCFVNISTRFSDGYQFGLGAEIGISTDKLHARGPMGLEELTTYKYIVEGDGQIRT